MRLTQRTDIALRALIFLACHEGERFSVQEMAAVLDVSFSHLQKAVQGLARAGFVETRRGKGGGNRLARSPDAITVGEVVRALEPIEPVECWLADNKCVLTPVCALIHPIDQAVEAFLTSLDGVRLSDMADRATRRKLVTLKAKTR